jgi:transcriptional regulator of arginine metabolism
MTVVRTKAARQQRIVDLLAAHPIRSQAELASLLAEDGVEVTQTTLSRDLDELGAVRVRHGDGQLVYAVPGEGGDPRPRPAADEAGMERLARRCAELLVTAEASANLVVLRTPPGAAQFLASAIDHSLLPTVLGTIAGDDTVVLVTKDPVGGRTVAQILLALATGTPPPSPSDNRSDEPDHPQPATHSAQGARP